MPGFESIAVAAICPRRKSGHEIDLGNALEVIDFLAPYKVSAIAIMGSTGEFIHFDMEERMRLTQMAVKRSRVPIIASVIHSTLDGTVKLAEEAEHSGAAAVLVMPPYYFRYEQPEIEEFYRRFRDRAAIDIPIYLYNIPFFTSPLESTTACRLLATGEFAGIKDSSGDIAYYDALEAQRASTPFNLLIGNDVIYTHARSVKADGVISGVACAIPELMQGLDRAITSQNEAKTKLLESRLQEFIAEIQKFPAPIGVREAVAARGLSTGPHFAPLSAVTQARLEMFRGWVKEWIPTVIDEARF